MTNNNDNSNATAATTTSQRNRQSQKWFKWTATLSSFCVLLLWACFSIQEWNWLFDGTFYPPDGENDVPEAASLETSNQAANAAEKRNQQNSPQFTPNNSDPSNSKLRHIPKSYGKFAIAYVVGGCTAESCLGYVLNALVASAILQSDNSKIPLFFMARMASHTPPNTRLSMEQETWLKKAGIQLQYLPRVQKENLGTILIEKFRVLEMTEFDRVLYVDSDALPRGNLDSFFEDSYQGVLQGFVGRQGSKAPLQASMFMVTPSEGLFQRFVDIIHRQRKERSRFDREIGWGHRHAANDEWRGLHWHGKNWTMYGAEIDQGLLYYFFKYEMLNWSCILKSRFVEHWKELLAIRNPDYHHSAPAVVAIEAPNQKSIFKSSTTTKVRDYVMHFPSDTKPWQKRIDGTIIDKIFNREKITRRAFWLKQLQLANDTFHLHLPTYIPPVEKSPASWNFSGWDVELFDPQINIPVPFRSHGDNS